MHCPPEALQWDSCQGHQCHHLSAPPPHPRPHSIVSIFLHPSKHWLSFPPRLLGRLLDLKDHLLTLRVHEPPEVAAKAVCMLYSTGGIQSFHQTPGGVVWKLEVGPAQTMKRAGAGWPLAASFSLPEESSSPGGFCSIMDFSRVQISSPWD